MDGKIRQVGNYSCGIPRFEVDIFLEYDEEYPLKDGERVASKLKIGDEQFISGIRYKEHLGPCMCPDLIDVYNQTKMRLADVLIKNGFAKNEEIKLEYDKILNKITIKKL